LSHTHMAEMGVVAKPFPFSHWGGQAISWPAR